MHDDDDALVSACQSGDMSAFECLVRKYQDRTIRVLYLILGNTDDAQDAAQETFIRAFRCIRSFRGRSSFATWLHRIALNTALNWIRDSKRARDASAPLEDSTIGAPRPEELFMARERTREIIGALLQLPAHYREAVILRHYDEMSYQEIAEVQRVPVGTVRSRLAKGRELLQLYLAGSRRANDHERTIGYGLQEGREADSSSRGRPAR